MIQECPPPQRYVPSEQHCSTNWSLKKIIFRSKQKTFRSLAFISYWRRLKSSETLHVGHKTLGYQHHCLAACSSNLCSRRDYIDKTFSSQITSSHSLRNNNKELSANNETPVVDPTILMMSSISSSLILTET